MDNGDNEYNVPNWKSKPHMHSSSMIPSSESIPMERPKVSSMQNLSPTIESLSEYNEYDAKEEEKAGILDQIIEENKEPIEDPEHYLKSAFSKDDVFSTTLDTNDFSESFYEMKNMKMIKTQFRENSFKTRINNDIFLGRRFKERSINDLKARDGFCYDNVQSFKEKTQRCPCYSKCLIF